MTVTDTFVQLFEPAIKQVVYGARFIEQRLGPGDDWVQDDRRHLSEWGDKLFRPLGRPMIREVSKDSFLISSRHNPDNVEALLSESGFHRNLLSTRKYREDHGGGRQWAVGSWVKDPDDTMWQHHVYLFPSENGEGTDVYSHREPSVRDPSEHHMADNIQRGYDGGISDFLGK